VWEFGVGPAYQAWEADLPYVVLEGTGLKSVFADCPLKTCSKLNNAGLGKPFHHLKQSTDGFYGVFMSFSLARGAAYRDSNGEKAPAHELFFVTRSERGALYGVTFPNFVRGHKSGGWTLESTVDRLPAAEVRSATTLVRNRLEARCVLPLFTIEATEAFKEVLIVEVQSRFREAGVSRAEFVEKPPVDAGFYAAGYIRGNALTKECLKSVAAAANATHSPPLLWTVEACSPHLWGVAFYRSV
jgi:hypothetical protein